MDGMVDLRRKAVFPAFRTGTVSVGGVVEETMRDLTVRLDRDERPGHKLLHPAEQSPRRRGVPEGEWQSERIDIDRSPHQPAREDRLHFRREYQPTRGKRVVERLDAELVAGKKQASPSPVPDGESKDAVQMRRALLAIVFVGAKDDLGVRFRAELVSLSLEPSA